MMQLFEPSRVRSVLCLGAHPDDIEIGCGATLARLLSPSVAVRWVVFSGCDKRRVEAEMSADAWLDGVEDIEVEVLRYRDGFFPAQWDSLKEEFLRLAADFSPDLIFTHNLQDRHQDHRVLAEFTWQAFRKNVILEYEIAKYEGDLGQPNCFVTLEEDGVNQKVDRLLQFHRSQTVKPWFDAELFRGFARLRGAECGAKYAEAFYARKLVW